DRRPPRPTSVRPCMDEAGRASRRPAGIEAKMTMREKIKTLAVDLLIQHGYRGTSIGDLAEPLDITRPNVHYYFGSKQALVEEVLDDYIRATLKQLRQIWTMPGITLLERIERTAAHSRNRYLKYNPSGKTGPPW